MQSHKDEVAEALEDNTAVDMDVPMLDEEDDVAAAAAVVD